MYVHRDNAALTTLLAYAECLNLSCSTGLCTFLPSWLMLALCLQWQLHIRSKEDEGAMTGQGQIFAAWAACLFLVMTHVYC